MQTVNLLLNELQLLYTLCKRCKASATKIKLALVKVSEYLEAAILISEISNLEKLESFKKLTLLE